MEAFTGGTLSNPPALARDGALVRASAGRRGETGESSAGAMGSCLLGQCELEGVRIRGQYVLFPSISETGGGDNAGAGF